MQPGNLNPPAVGPARPFRPAPVGLAAEPPPNPMQRAGNWFLLGYLFISLSRVLDVTISLRVAAVLYGGIILAAFVSGGFLLILQTPIGRSLVALIFWLGLSIPFSTWPTGSLESLQESLKAFFLAVAIIAIPRTVEETLRLIKAVAFAIFGAAMLTWVYGRLDYGRLVLTAGTYADPNQFAMTLLIAVPLWVVIAKQAGGILTRVLASLCILPILIAFLRTGSRGGLVGLGVMLVIAFFLTPGTKKLMLVAGAVATMLLGLAVLPDYLRVRYLTVFSAESSDLENLTEEERSQLTGGDIGSSQGRFRLLMDSLELTWQNPLFGVGLGQFPYVNWDRYKKQGKPTQSVVTHNAYTQFSSEAGVPALIIFSILLYHCWRTSSAVVRMGRQQRAVSRTAASVDFASAANALRISLVVLMSCSFFLSVAYSQLFYVMAAIIARFYMTAQATEAQLVRNTRPAPLAPLAAIPVASPKPPASVPAPVAAATPARAPRSKLSPWRTAPSHVRHSRLS